MPEFSLPNAVNGATVKSTDFSGKTLLVTFCDLVPAMHAGGSDLIELQRHSHKTNFPSSDFLLMKAGQALSLS